MSKPGSNQFADYFEALHGYGPFPWQRRLAESILERGRWPSLLDIPTGLGKTSAIDVALFVLATRPDISPRRIIMVVDRRVVVDQAAAHARGIQQRLASSSRGILADVAASLRGLWGGAEHDDPFEVSVLRGGMPRDEAWAHRPDRPVVGLSTVDQVGSRLLFRGYGVSASMAPVHAGLLGHDALILLDEVQLSTAFAQTLQALEQRWRSWREWREESPKQVHSIPNRWAFVRMSATPVGDEAKPEARLALNDEDFAHPVVRERLDASKLATLAAPIATIRNDSERTLRVVVEAFAAAAVQHFDAGARRLVVIVNRVLTAQRIHLLLEQKIGERADVVLLTGRMRPLDRDRVLGNPDEPRSVAGRVVAGRSAMSEQRPVVIVSTQTIEAGADFDFDALVTECASIDALRQRFGRLDRRGKLKQTRATILIRKDQASDSKDDPVYGAALSKTWAWLEAKGGQERVVDFGMEHFPQLPSSPEERGDLCSPVQRAPVLLPAHIDAWAQTNPRGEPDPDVALWLHGPQRGTPEVRVVWRADIDATTLNDEALEDEVERYASASLSVAPPSSLESISVPLPSFRAWLTGGVPLEVPDVEGAQDDSSRYDEKPSRSRAFLVVTQSGAKVQRDVTSVRPEATVVVPASYGGIRAGNWSPDAKEPVRDWGDWAQFVHRGRPVLRLVPDVLASGMGLMGSNIPRMPSPEQSGFNARLVVRDWLEEVREEGAGEWKLIVAYLVGQGVKRLRVIELGGSGYLAASGPNMGSVDLAACRRNVDPTSEIVNDDVDTASYIGREVGLMQHLDDVERWARTFSRNMLLPESIAGDLALAARLHDIGKADPRFQQMLHGGSAVRMAASNRLLAKSQGDARDRAAREQARTRAGYPDGYRHELLSVAMLEANAQKLNQANDPDLVLHLVGSHHGWCRPFAPAVESGPSMRVQVSLDEIGYDVDAAHQLASVDSSVAERYWSVTERYGWWTLAWFEAVMRLADHRASEESSRGHQHRTGEK